MTQEEETKLAQLYPAMLKSALDEDALAAAAKPPATEADELRRLYPSMYPTVRR